MSDNSEDVTVSITEAFADAERVSVYDVRPGDFVFDVYGGRRKVKRVRVSAKRQRVTVIREDGVTATFGPRGTVTIVRGAR